MVMHEGPEAAFDAALDEIAALDFLRSPAAGDPGDRGGVRLSPLTRVRPMPPPLIERYRDRLPLEPGDPVVTPERGLDAAGRGAGRSPSASAPACYLKLEGANPTGSFKDRGMTVAVSRAKGAGRRGRDLRLDRQHGGQRGRLRRAGRAARRGDRPGGQDRDRQARPGADARRAGDRAARQLRPTRSRSSASSRRRHPVELVNSVNPYRIEGQKTAAFEVCDELGGPPDALAIPVGNAGNITAWWRGFREYEAAPVLYGFQAEGAAPLVRGQPVAEPETVASAIRIGNPARWEEAMDAVTASRGRIAAVSDEQILDAYRLLASARGRLLRAGLGGVGRRDPRPRAAGAGGRRAARDRRLRAHRPRPQGPRHGARQGAGGDRLRRRTSPRVERAVFD